MANTLPYQLYFFKGYNNYKNRQVKFSDALSDYTSNYTFSQPLNSTFTTTTAVDFNENDGVETECVVNWKPSPMFEPDYMLVVTNDGNNTIVSRWFVMEWVRTRSNQYRATLRRDVIADNYNDLQTVPLFVQKGILRDDNPLIYTKESLEVNQIKKEEVLLKDETEKSWIVGYFNSTLGSTANVSSKKYSGEKIIAKGDLPLYFSTGSTTSGKIYRKTSNVYFKGQAFTKNYYEKNIYYKGQIKFRTALTDYLTPIATLSSYESFGRILANAVNDYDYFSADLEATKLDEITQKWREVLENYPSTIISDLHTYLASISRDYILANVYADLLDTNTVIYDGDDGKYYRISLFKTAERDRKILLNSSTVMPSEFAIGNLAADNIATIGGITKIIKGNPFSIEYKEIEYSFYLVDITSQYPEEQLSSEISATARQLEDAPYKMFFLENTPENLTLAQDIALKLDKNLYDLQILPYCPDVDLYKNYINSKGDLIEHVDYSDVKDANNTTVSMILYSKISSRKFYIEYLYEVVDKKIENQCDFVRIVSPNFNGAFSFIPAKNDGIIGFNVYLTYKPYTPYIQVSPEFNGLYGSNFDDARGLICNGDFSIATISDSWISYENNNKNYQNIFNANIKTNDFDNSINLLESVTSIGAGMVKTAATTMIATKNPYGAAVGAAAGLVSGITNVAGGQASYYRNRQNKIDQFGYQIGNIKAQPDTLNKVSAYNVNNKYFPFLEFYSCTDEEKEVLKNKIKYNGMTVMAIGKIEDYVGNNYEGLNYFQAQFVSDTANNLKCDTHLVEVIDEELQLGIYLQ